MFVYQKLSQFVVEFYDGERLDKYGRSRRRSVVNKTRDLSLTFAFYGNNVSVAAHRNDIVLKVFRVSAADISVEFLLYLVVGTADSASYLSEFSGCAVVKFGFVHYRFGYPSFGFRVGKHIGSVFLY